MLLGDVIRRQCPGSVDDNPGAPPARRAQDGDVHTKFNSGWGRRATQADHSPELACARVAEDRGRSAGEYPGHPPPGLAESPVADGENLSMNAVQATGPQAGCTPLAVNADALKLLERDHSVLPRRNSSDSSIPGAVGDFCIHVHA